MNDVNIQRNHSEINNSVNMLDDGNASMMHSIVETTTAVTSAQIAAFVHNGISFGNNTNITPEEIKDFLARAVSAESAQQNLSLANRTATNHSIQSFYNESITCHYYCNGMIKDLFANYKNMHGYISLVVSRFL